MHHEGKFEVKASQEKVWSFLMDPQSIGNCVPGVESIEVIDKTKFKSSVKTGIGPIKSIFKFSFEIKDVNPITHAKLEGRGSGSGSYIDLVTSFDLVANGESETVLNWTADSSISGMIASIGLKFVEGAAKSNIQQIFKNLKNKLEQY